MAWRLLESNRFNSSRSSRWVCRRKASKQGYAQLFAIVSTVCLGGMKFDRSDHQPRIVCATFPFLACTGHCLAKQIGQQMEDQTKDFAKAGTVAEETRNAGDSKAPDGFRLVLRTAKLSLSTNPQNFKQLYNYNLYQKLVLKTWRYWQRKTYHFMAQSSFFK